MILESIFLWVGGITLICGVLLILFMILDKLLGMYFRNIGFFWRMIYTACFIRNKEKYLNKIINESNGKKYRIVLEEPKKQQEAER